eukprot:g31070.t1
MAFATLLRRLMKAGEFGKRCVPMVTDEARTFGMNSFFHEFKIHAPFGQHYTPVDHDILMKYAEADTATGRNLTEADQLRRRTASAGGAGGPRAEDPWSSEAMIQAEIEQLRPLLVQHQQRREELLQELEGAQEEEKQAQHALELSRLTQQEKRRRLRKTLQHAVQTVVMEQRSMKAMSTPEPELHVLEERLDESLKGLRHQIHRLKYSEQDKQEGALRIQNWWRCILAAREAGREVVEDRIERGSIMYVDNWRPASKQQELRDSLPPEEPISLYGRVMEFTALKRNRPSFLPKDLELKKMREAGLIPPLGFAWNVRAGLEPRVKRRVWEGGER